MPEIHLGEFPSVTKCCHTHESDHVETLNYRFLVCNPANGKGRSTNAVKNSVLLKLQNKHSNGF